MKLPELSALVDHLGNDDAVLIVAELTTLEPHRPTHPDPVNLILDGEEADVGRDGDVTHGADLLAVAVQALEMAHSQIEEPHQLARSEYSVFPRIFDVG